MHSTQLGPSAGVRSAAVALSVCLWWVGACANGDMEPGTGAMAPGEGTGAGVDASGDASGADPAAPMDGTTGSDGAAGGSADPMGMMGDPAGDSGSAAMGDDDPAIDDPAADDPAADDPAADDPAADDPEPREDLGEGDGSDVITIGDSWMSLLSTGIQQSLVAVSGQPYRTYGVGGTRLLNEAIPGQYESAKEEDPDILTVVMTGGGNDIIQVPGLREDCDMGGEMCGMVVGDILDRLSDLWAEMAEDGVQDVIYVQYATPEGMNVDFALPDGDSVSARCDAVPEPLRCHTLETVDIVMGDIPDGIHPSAEAYDRIGEAVYGMMVERGMRR